MPFKLIFENEIHRSSSIPDNFQYFSSYLLNTFRSKLPSPFWLYYDTPTGQHLPLRNDEEYQNMKKIQSEKPIRIFIIDKQPDLQIQEIEIENISNYDIIPQSLNADHIEEVIIQEQRKKQDIPLIQSYNNDQAIDNLISDVAKAQLRTEISDKTQDIQMKAAVQATIEEQIPIIIAKIKEALIREGIITPALQIQNEFLKGQVSQLQNLVLQQEFTNKKASEILRENIMLREKVNALELKTGILSKTTDLQMEESRKPSQNPWQMEGYHPPAYIPPPQQHIQQGYLGAVSYPVLQGPVPTDNQAQKALETFRGNFMLQMDQPRKPSQNPWQKDGYHPPAYIQQHIQQAYPGAVSYPVLQGPVHANNQPQGHYQVPLPGQNVSQQREKNDFFAWVGRAVENIPSMAAEMFDNLGQSLEGDPYVYCPEGKYKKSTVDKVLQLREVFPNEERKKLLDFVEKYPKNVPVDQIASVYASIKQPENR